MATHSNFLAWEIPWTEEPGRLQSMGVTKSRTQLNEHSRILILPIFKCGEHFVFDYRSQCVESQKTRALVLILSRLLQLPVFW